MIISLSVTLLSTINLISQCFDTKTQTTNLWATRKCIILRCRVLKVCLDHLIYMIFSLHHLLFYCIAPRKLWLNFFDPSLPSNTKSTKIAIIDQGNTNIFSNLLILQYIMIHCSFSSSTTFISDPSITTKTANSTE